MPITKKEVLEILDDARLRSIRFTAGPISINADEYGKVYDYIDSGAISVKPWKEKYSQYEASANLIRTAPHDPPLTPVIKSNVLHECTHVIADMNKVKVTRLVDEAAAYLAQTAYHLMLDPAYDPPTIRGVPEYDMIRLCVTLVKDYGLGKGKGMGATISQDDLTVMARLIPTLPEYSRIKEGDVAVADGISMDGGESERFYRRQAVRVNTQLLNDLMSEETQRLLDNSIKVRIVAYENAVTGDEELLELFEKVGAGTSDANKAAVKRLHKLFLTITQRSASEYKQRLSTLTKGDKVSEKFYKTFLPRQRDAYLDALRVAR